MGADSFLQIWESRWSMQLRQVVPIQVCNAKGLEITKSVQGMPSLLLKEQVRTSGQSV